MLERMFDVRGQSVIVTGGASGIGRAYAEIMAAQGARVCIFDLDQHGSHNIRRWYATRPTPFRKATQWATYGNDELSWQRCTMA